MTDGSRNAAIAEAEVCHAVPAARVIVIENDPGRHDAAAPSTADHGH